MLQNDFLMQNLCEIEHFHTRKSCLFSFVDPMSNNNYYSLRMVKRLFDFENLQR